MFSTHYNIFKLNFGILLLLKGSFWEFGFFTRLKFSLLCKLSIGILYISLLLKFVDFCVELNLTAVLK